MTLAGPASCIQRTHRSYAAPPLALSPLTVEDRWHNDAVMVVSGRPSSSCRLMLLKHRRRAKASLRQEYLSRSAREE